MKKFEAAPRQKPKEGVHERVVAQLASMIVGGTISPGDTVPAEPELMEMLGVSRTAVREAVKFLAAKGMLQARRRVGTIVLPESNWSLLDPEVLRWQATGQKRDFLVDLLDFREMVEPAILHMVTRANRPHHRKRIGDAFKSMVKNQYDSSRLYESILAFHLTVLSCAENRFVSQLRPVVETVIRIVLTAQSRNPVPAHIVIPAHQRIIDALLAGQPARAEEAMREMIVGSRSIVLTQRGSPRAAASRAHRALTGGDS